MSMRRIAGNRARHAMNLNSFRQSLSDVQPPDHLPAALRALWHLGRNEWERAHAIVQDEEGADSAWVHAHLHRVEGDLSNARYWYSRAGKTAHSGTTDAEWSELATALLDVSGRA